MLSIYTVRVPHVIYLWNIVSIMIWNVVGRVGESKEHHCWFKEPLICHKGSFVLILFCYLYHIVSLIDINYCD
jgi:hypothetical protein